MSNTSPQKDTVPIQNPNEKRQIRCGKDLKIAQDCQESFIEICSMEELSGDNSPLEQITTCSNEKLSWCYKSSIQKFEPPNQPGSRSNSPVEQITTCSIEELSRCYSPEPLKSSIEEFEPLNQPGSRSNSSVEQITTCSIEELSRCYSLEPTLKSSIEEFEPPNQPGSRSNSPVEQITTCSIEELLRCYYPEPIQKSSIEEFEPPNQHGSKSNSSVENTVGCSIEEFEPPNQPRSVGCSIEEFEPPNQPRSKTAKQLSIVYKVPEHLRRVNVKAYEPQMIAIGPFTYDLRSKNHLKRMEEYKKRFLTNLLERRGEESEKDYLMAMKDLEERARRCYSEPVSLSSDKFVEMMLHGACFIVELFRNQVVNKWDDDNDPIFRLNWIRRKLGYDLLLADNQLPFFVLQEFYNMSKTPEEKAGNINLHDMVLQFFEFVFQKAPSPDVQIADKEINHLLGFIHDYFWKWEPLEVTKPTEHWNFTRCATELQEAGIKFQKIEAPSWFYIEFDKDKGIMKIPELTIDDDTESLFRNLIVYEQYEMTTYGRFVSYTKFMDCLINTAKDVKILCDDGIFKNCLGDEEVVAQMFNRLGDSVWLKPGNYYGEITKQVNEYCAKLLNRWMANLWHNYFNTPWAIISFFAALLLLILTVAQTVFSVLAYFQ